MANSILNYSSNSLNLSCDFLDDLHECLGKAEALAYVALSEHFAEADPKIIHDYLWQLGDLIEKAIAIIADAEKSWKERR